MYTLQALFMAHGPAFKVNHTVPEFENIELYNLMTGKSADVFCFFIFLTITYLKKLKKAPV